MPSNPHPARNDSSASKSRSSERDRLALIPPTGVEKSDDFSPRKVALLKSRNADFIGSEEGLPACGHEAIGRLRSVDDIVERALTIIAEKKWRKYFCAVRTSQFCATRRRERIVAKIAATREAA